MQILVVDDEPGIRELVGLALEADGHAVKMAGTWADALQIWSSWQTLDGAVVDATLPDVEPGRVLERLAEWARAGRHVLLMTGWHGIVAPIPVLQKPFRLEHLRRLIAGWGASA